MLRQVSVQNIVLVDRLDLEFDGGLVALTGETGAGKSILLDALGLVLGARADSGLVRSGAESAAVSALFDLPQDHPALAVMTEQGIEAEPGEPFIVRRVVKSDGGSRAFAAGTSVPANLLRDFGAMAVEIHGQHDDRGLLNPRGHRALLDSFGRIDTRKTQQAFAAMSRLERELAEARDAVEASARDRDFLAFSSAEIDALAPVPGEETSLADKRSSMQAGARAGESLAGLDELIGGAEGAVAKLRQAARKLDRGAEVDPALAEALASLDRAIIEANDADARIARAADSLSFDPADLEAIETRLFDIRALARKHRIAPDDLAAFGKQMRDQLAAIDSSGDRLDALEGDLAAARAAYEREAAALCEARRTAARQLDDRVASELSPLKLDSARFRTSVVAGDPGPLGTDRVEFEISTNPGAPFGPLAKIASGGELSRFILALKVALAEAGHASTMVFDEIDRGVGGAVASAIGERLSALARDSQVLVVTHSPQVAARATSHYRIEKTQVADGARTTVRKLSDSERREEIARMLSGSQITDEARAQAAKLLEAA